MKKIVLTLGCILAVSCVATANTWSGDDVTDVFMITGAGALDYGQVTADNVTGYTPIMTVGVGAGVSVGEITSAGDVGVVVGRDYLRAYTAGWSQVGAIGPQTGYSPSRNVVGPALSTAIIGNVGGNVQIAAYVQTEESSVTANQIKPLMYYESGGFLTYSGNGSFYNDYGRAVAGGNVDGDANDADMVVSINDGTEGWLFLFEITNADDWWDNSYRTGYQVASGSGYATDVTIGNLDGDGFGDVVYVMDDGTVGWLESTGDNAWTPRSISITGANCTAFGDVDGDGKVELMVGTDSGIDWYEVEGGAPVFKSSQAISGGVTDLAISTIPEPTTAALLICGAVAFVKRNKN